MLPFAVKRLFVVIKLTVCKQPIQKMFSITMFIKVFKGHIRQSHQQISVRQNDVEFYVSDQGDDSLTK